MFLKYRLGGEDVALLDCLEGKHPKFSPQLKQISLPPPPQCDHLAVLPPRIEVWSVLVGKSAMAFPQAARELPVTLLAPLCQFSRGLRGRLADSHRVSHLPSSL